MGNAGSSHVFASVPYLDDIAEAAEAVRSPSVDGVDGDPECSSVNAESYGVQQLFRPILALDDPVSWREARLPNASSPHFLM